QGRPPPGIPSLNRSNWKSSGEHARYVCNPSGACRRQHRQIGGPVNIILTILISAFLQADGSTALHWAVYKDDVQTVKRLIDSGAKVNAANREGATVFSLACINGNAAIIQELLKAGA